MDIYVYSDESGVFDYKHNDIFVFGGILFYSKEQRDVCARKYIHVERIIRKNGNYQCGQELKATAVTLSDKGKLFRSVAQYQRFGIVISQNLLLKSIFNTKKDKQRNLDFAYKIGLKRLFEHLMRDGILSADDVNNIYISVDEHTTATNGIYELREAIEREFKCGTHNWNYSTYFPPIFTSLQNVTVSFCNSAKKPLIRSADIIANRLYYVACNKPDDLHKQGIFVVELPES